MEGSDSLLWLVLLILALLAGAVLYLLASRRHYQRTDYSRLVEQDVEREQLNARLRRLEQLIADLAEYDRRRRSELEAFARETRAELAAEIQRAREQIVAEVLASPERWEDLLLQQSGALPPAPPPTTTEPVIAEDTQAPENPQLLRFLKGPRQRRIAELLEQGLGAQDVARQLSVSRHEVDLVSAIMFKTKSA
jgi:DNA-binding NarL/FixJ family response regulator